MDNQEALKRSKIIQDELYATKRFLSNYTDKRKNMTMIQAFDNITADDESQEQLPEILKKILNSKVMVEGGDKALQHIFDGLEMGIEEYQRRNGGDNPPIESIYAGMAMAYNGFIENSKDPEAQKAIAQYDKLSFDHHESLSVVPAAIQVTLMTNIASSLPIVAQLPNPIGSNEVPLLFGQTTANMRMGVFDAGDLIDGSKAGLPYLENRHTLVMEAGAGAGEFEITSRVGYTAQKDANGATKFVIDDSTKVAPYLGGRVVILVKGVPVGRDDSKSHATKSGISFIQPIDGQAVEIDGKKYLVKSGKADLDNHTVTVTFDTAAGNEAPAQDEVEVQLVFDYERKNAEGRLILTPPGLDLTYGAYSIYASPMRAFISASIDAITQMRNELGLDWNGAVLAIVQQKYNLEQTARLLRDTRRACLMQQKHSYIIDLDKDGIQFNSVEGKLAAAKGSLLKAKVSITQMTNRAVGAVDYYVSDAGALYFSSMDANNFRPTGVAYGDSSSIYRIGTLADGTNVYYIPDSLGVFDNTTNNGKNAEILVLPRPAVPETAPFIGMTAVPPIALTANGEMFEEQVGVYARISAERNPNPLYANQAMLIKIMNVPSL